MIITIVSLFVKTIFVCLLNRKEEHPCGKDNLPTKTHCIERILPWKVHV